MDTITISSKSNNLIKKAALLQSSAKRRREYGQFFIEGLRLCRDAFLTGMGIDTLFFTKTAYDKSSELLDNMMSVSKSSFFVTEEIAAKLCDTVNPQGIFCICDMPANEFKMKKSGRYIVLENVADPSNVGTIIRTAEALGLDGAVLSADCCDLYNPKTLRASMGSIFRMPVAVKRELAGFIKNLTDEGYLTAAAVVSPDAERITELALHDGCAVIIGNEANGITEQLKSVCAVQTTIPMLGRAESLNAAMAGTVIMWEMMR